MTYFFPAILYAVIVATTPTAANMPSGLCVGVPFQDTQPVGPLLAELGTECWLDWHYASSGPGYVPMVYAPAYMDVAPKLMRRQPERLWLVLNEPERSDQAKVTPSEAVQLTQAVDATGAPWACCGTIAWDNSWLDAYLDAGGAVPDIWHVHAYGVETPQAWQAQINSFYAWMEGRNVARPVIVSETNAGAGDVDAQAELLAYVRTATAEDDRLLAVFWFATRYYSAGDAALFDDAGRLTPVGAAFVE